MKIIGFFLLLVCLQACKDKATEPNIQNKPNILLIIADDVGLDACLGYSLGTVKPTMPNLQKLINNGLIFNNVWSNPTCTPTRSGIITGKYGFRTGVTKVGDQLSTVETSLHSYLAEQNSGYSTAVIGKWHIGNSATHPREMGVPHYEGSLLGAAPSYTNWDFTQNESTSPSTEYITTKFTDLAIDWLGKQTQPWFLWLAYTAPHTPFHLPPSNLHTQSGLADDAATIEANPLPYYMAMLESLDTEMGRVLNSLSEEELANTIIIFIGDNGDPPQVAQVYNTKRAKGTVYQGGINVPMIVSGYGVSRTNQAEDALINTTDLFATICEIAGTGVTAINDSWSFKSMLNNPNAPKRKFAYSEIGTDNGVSNYAIRNETHKYIKFEDGSEALYNLSVNPMENQDLLSSNQLPLSSKDSTQLAELLEELALLKE